MLTISGFCYKNSSRGPHRSTYLCKRTQVHGHERPSSIIVHLAQKTHNNQPKMANAWNHVCLGCSILHVWLGLAQRQSGQSAQGLKTSPFADLYQPSRRECRTSRGQPSNIGCEFSTSSRFEPKLSPTRAQKFTNLGHPHSVSHIVHAPGLEKNA